MFLNELLLNKKKLDILTEFNLSLYEAIPGLALASLRVVPSVVGVP